MLNDDYNTVKPLVELHNRNITAKQSNKIRSCISKIITDERRPSLDHKKLIMNPLCSGELK